MTNLLDEDRMSRMRSNVLNAVDDDTRTRGQKMRRRLGVGTAAATLLVVGTVGSSLINTQSSSMDTAAAPYSSSAADDGDTRAGAEMAQEPADAALVDGSEALPTDARQVIVTGTAEIIVKDPREAAADVAQWVEQHGGRIDARQVSGSDDRVYASLTLRVPASQVSATLQQFEEYGEVVNVYVAKDDVTSTTRDLDARIKALNISIERLEQILEDATSTDQVVRAEQSLTDRQSQLEQLVSQRSQLSEQVSLATIDVSLSAEQKTSSVDPGGFRGGLQNGWNALVDTVNSIVEGVGAALPWVGVLVALYLVYRLGRLVVRRRN